jgi:probable HAF family extracellular repeat protein
MKTFFDDMPREIEEAALVEGCSRLRVFTRITFPLGNRTTAFGINASGEVAGFYNDSSGTTHGFIFASGAFRIEVRSSCDLMVTNRRFVSASPGRASIQRHLVRGLISGAFKSNEAGVTFRRRNGRAVEPTLRDEGARLGFR